MALPIYATTGQSGLVLHLPGDLRRLIFFFLIFPIIIIIPLSFNAEDFFTFTPGMLAFDPVEAYSTEALSRTSSRMTTGSWRCPTR